MNLRAAASTTALLHLRGAARDYNEEPHGDVLVPRLLVSVEPAIFAELQA